MALIPPPAPTATVRSQTLLADAQTLLDGVAAHLDACDSSMDRSARHLADVQARLRALLQARVDAQTALPERRRPRVPVRG